MANKARRFKRGDVVRALNGKTYTVANVRKSQAEGLDFVSVEDPIAGTDLCYIRYYHSDQLELVKAA